MLRRPRRSCLEGDRGGGHGDGPREGGGASAPTAIRRTPDSHFVFVGIARPASLACTALGRPCPNWLTVRTSFPLEKSISRNFSLCMGFPYSSFNRATIFLVFTSTTSPDERKAYCPSMPIVI